MNKERQLKFKCWDRENQKMTIPRTLLTWINDCAEYEWQLKSNQMDKFENFLWLQYTGLNDSEGIEIYEGDILNMIIINATITEGIVEFSNGCFVVKQSSGEYMSDDLSRHNLLAKITGNIYEN